MKSLNHKKIWSLFRGDNVLLRWCHQLLQQEIYSWAPSLSHWQRCDMLFVTKHMEGQNQPKMTGPWIHNPPLVPLQKGHEFLCARLYILLGPHHSDWQSHKVLSCQWCHPRGEKLWSTKVGIKLLFTVACWIGRVCITSCPHLLFVFNEPIDAFDAWHFNNSMAVDWVHWSCDEDTQEHSQFQFSTLFTLMIKIWWSKNMSEEREFPVQILFGSMDLLICPLFNLAALLEFRNGNKSTKLFCSHSNQNVSNILECFLSPLFWTYRTHSIFKGAAAFASQSGLPKVGIVEFFSLFLKMF